MLNTLINEIVTKRIIRICDNLYNVGLDTAIDTRKLGNAIS